MDGDRDQARERGVLVDESSARRSRGSRETRPAIASPSVTESVISASATSPDGAARQPPAVVHRVAAGHAVTTVAVVEHEHAAAVAARAARGRAPGPDSSAAFASASASAAVGASAVALTTPVQAGAPVAGSSRWW